MSKDILYEIEAEDTYCGMCRTPELIYKGAIFKQYNGWYCRSCYELIDEDADENDDENYIITIRLLRVMILTAYPCGSNKTYYNMKLVCQEIKRLNSALT